MGQGIATSYVQLAVDVFGVPPERIRVLQGDTDRANGFGSAGSRSLFTGGSAVRVASERTIAKSKERAGEVLEVAPADIEYLEGRFKVVGTDVGIGLFELAGKQPEQHIYLDSTSAVGGPTWPNACHVCEVEIDPGTGHVAVVGYASVNDIGRVVSPAIVTGQIEGGAVQGIGQALSEQIVYDRDSGQILTASFQDYAMPHADVASSFFKTRFDTSIPCTTNLLGVKGVGELGTIGATPATVKRGDRRARSRRPRPRHRACADAVDAAARVACAGRRVRPVAVRLKRRGEPADPLNAGAPSRLREGRSCVISIASRGSTSIDACGSRPLVPRRAGTTHNLRRSPMKVSGSRARVTVIAAAASLMAASAMAGIGVTPTTDPTTLGTALGGSGVTINSVTVTNGAASQFGTYTGFNGSVVTLGNGIVLSSGKAVDTANVGTFIDTTTGAAGTSEFDAYGAGHVANFSDSNDVAALKVSFTLASASAVSFSFAFGSMEFPDYVNDFTDAFLVFLDGTGVANQIVFDASSNPVQVGSSFASSLVTTDASTAFTDPHGLVGVLTTTTGTL
ncbi:MAG TPA: molybdopterin cofactor-binding domain-containing protein, partial [Burkholderiaceae bacterium]|nr:molybdopterin cofactor-binding domain-containing protein [Burkholderiaceae bacterium]